jgi:hypothetical protein
MQLVTRGTAGQFRPGPSYGLLLVAGDACSMHGIGVGRCHIVEGGFSVSGLHCLVTFLAGSGCVRDMLSDVTVNAGCIATQGDLMERMVKDRCG